MYIYIVALHHNRFVCIYINKRMIHIVCFKYSLLLLSFYICFICISYAEPLKTSWTTLAKDWPTQKQSKAKPQPLVAERVWFDNAAPTLTNNGPGHMPAKPQPVPKIAPPTMSLASMAAVTGSGSRNGSPNVELLSWFLMMRIPGMIAANAAPMTKPKDGSHVLCVNCKKVDTFAGLTIWETTKPTPKRMPVAPWTTDFTISAACEPRLMMILFLARYPMVAYPANAEARILPYNALSACVAETVFAMAFTAVTAFPFPVSVTTCNSALVLNIVAASAPNAINVHTFATERTDKRPMPDNPCPLVHPPPNFEPKPTNSIAKTKREVPSTTSYPPAGSKCAKPKYGKTSGVATIPANNGNLVSKAAFEIPDIEKGETSAEHPIVSPVDKYLPKTAAAKINPPPAAFSGSNFAM